MAVQVLSSAERTRARFVLAREARALGVDRTLFKAKPGEPRRPLPEPVAEAVRKRAPNYAVALATAGCPEPLAHALINLFDQARGEEEGQ